MEHDIVQLDIEEKHELLFKIKVEGAEQAPSKVRLVCEHSDIAYMFNGHPTDQDGVIAFNIPVMKDKLTEGIHNSRVEVLIENKYFSPVEFQINFKKPVKVVAEAITTRVYKKQPDISVSAIPVLAQKQPDVVHVKPITQAESVAQDNKQFTLKERHAAKTNVLLDKSAVKSAVKSFVNKK